MNFMNRLSALSISVLLGLSVGVTDIQAQNLGIGSGPAEYPPTSYKGQQYVDSRGCAFIRAGYGQRITWVPRVSRSRKLLCGFRPTLAQAAPRAERVDPAPVQTQAVRTRPAVKTTTRVQPDAPRKAVRVIRAEPAPKVNPRAVTAPRAKPTDRKIAPCVGASDFSAQFINKGARCGPQTASPTTVIRREIGPLGAATGSSEYRGPVGTNARIERARVITPPKGYRNAYSDGRQNPLRGVGTTSGRAKMEMIWSNTVPRYLIDPRTGKRVN